MDYLVVGVNHKSAPIDVREKVSIGKEALQPILRELLSLDHVHEGLVLSTCNRTEVYAVSSAWEKSLKKITEMICHRHSLDVSDVKPYLYNYHSQEAVKHLFCVASSLDSLVVGEGQIVGQVKAAYQAALDSKTTGMYLNRFFHRALYVSKKIRTETEISAKSVSIGSIAISLAKKIFGDLSQKKVLLLGAGEIGELVLRYLEDEGVYDFYLLNRSRERATRLIRDDTGVVLPLEKIDEILPMVDLVISSLGSTEHVITQQKMKQVMEVRKNQPVFLIDLGIPRNIDPQVSRLSNVYVYNIDDLQSVAQENKDVRQDEAQRAMALVEKEASQFYETMVLGDPTIAILGRKFHAIRRRELERTLNKLKQISAEEIKAFEKCTEVIVNKILFDPIMAVKKSQAPKQGAKDWLRKLFRLDEE